MKILDKKVRLEDGMDCTGLYLRDGSVVREVTREGGGDLGECCFEVMHGTVEYGWSTDIYTQEGRLVGRQGESSSDILYMGEEAVGMRQITITAPRGYEFESNVPRPPKFREYHLGVNGSACCASHDYSEGSNRYILKPVFTPEEGVVYAFESGRMIAYGLVLGSTTTLAGDEAWDTTNGVIPKADWTIRELTDEERGYE